MSQQLLGSPLHFMSRTTLRFRLLIISSQNCRDKSGSISANVQAREMYGRMILQQVLEPNSSMEHPHNDEAIPARASRWIRSLHIPQQSIRITSWVRGWSLVVSFRKFSFQVMTMMVPRGSTEWHRLCPGVVFTKSTVDCLPMCER